MQGQNLDDLRTSSRQWPFGRLFGNGPNALNGANTTFQFFDDFVGRIKVAFTVISTQYN